MILAFVAIATALATFFGGLFALRLKDQLHIILGFSAGAVVGVAFFDLMPEALKLAGVAYETGSVVTIIALGFFIYLILDRVILLHTHTDHDHTAHTSAGAATLCIHSFLDGIGIGFAFHVAPTVGAIVAAAVIAHDFSDGINTVNFVLRDGNRDSSAFRWLIVDALAPIAGIIMTFFFVIPASQLGLLLALFSGFFLYIGASDLIPESHHGHSMRWTTLTTVAGATLMYIVVTLA